MCALFGGHKLNTAGMNFRKVFRDLPAVLRHADDAVFPGADGALYGSA